MLDDPNSFISHRQTLPSFHTWWILLIWFYSNCGSNGETIQLFKEFSTPSGCLNSDITVYVFPSDGWCHLMERDIIRSPSLPLSQIVNCVVYIDGDRNIDLFRRWKEMIRIHTLPRWFVFSSQGELPIPTPLWSFPLMRKFRKARYCSHFITFSTTSSLIH